MIIEKLDHKGRGILHLNNKIVFIDNALPLEDVDIKIVNSKSKYDEAIVLKYNKKSSKREKVLCPYYDSCGGCDLLHLKYDDEIIFKKRKVEEILSKYAHININIKEIIKTNEYNYRNKATFQVKENIGYYKKKSYDLIPISNCLIVDDKINEILKKIKKINLKNIKQIIIRINKEQNDTMLIIKKSGPIDLKFKALDVSSIISIDKNDISVIKGKGYIIEKMHDLKFIISPLSFFQVNTSAAICLYDKVLEYADLKGNEKVLDLYCGTGTIGLFLSKKASSVIGVEINKSAINDAKYNKSINDINNVDFILDDVANIVMKDFDLVVVDPPRGGLNKKVINDLIKIKSKKIIYISCNPITLARDLDILKDFYELKDITLVNMFPKTEHVESVALLSLKTLKI